MTQNLLDCQIVKRIALKQIEAGELEKRETELESTIKRLKTKYNRTLSINQLPLEVICLILKKLDYCDLLACEQVCEQWNYSVGALGLRRLEIVKKLRIMHKATKIRPRKLFFVDSKRQVPNKAMNLKDLHFEVPENSFLINLKQLRICDPHLKISCDHNVDAPLLDDVNFVNRLVNLEMLEVSRMRFDDDCTISLPNLKYLSIHYLNSKVIVDCPKLTAFHTKEANDERIKFLFPESITHLYLDFYKTGFEDLKNLKYLCIGSLDFTHRGVYSTYKTIDFLTRFTNLAEISLRPYESHERNLKIFVELLEKRSCSEGTI